MQKLRNVLVIFLLLILTALSLVVLYSVIRFVRTNSPASSTPPPLIVLPNGEGPLPNSATEQADAGVPIPTIEYSFLYNRDYAGLQEYLNDQAQNWVNLTFNIHSFEVFGVGVSSEKVSSVACTWPVVDKILCRTAEIEYTAVYKGLLTGGVQADFVLHPLVTLKEDWTEINRTTTDQKVEVTYGSTAIITYSGDLCVTSVEENTPSSVQENDLPPLDKSYTIKSKDERRLWPDLGPYIFPTGIDENFLRIDAYKKAKDAALTPDKVLLLYDFIQADLLPGGPFYEAIRSFYTPELAQLYGVKGFELVFLPTRGDPLLRCDGTQVNR